MSAIRQNLTPAHPSRLLPDHGKSNPGIWAAANQPDGQITKSLSSLSGKNSSLLLSGKSALGLPPSRPTRGAIARRHERGAGCGGRESVRRCQGMAGRVDKARELTNGTQTDDAWPGEAFGGDGSPRTAKSCGSDASKPASSLRRRASPTGL